LFEPLFRQTAEIRLKFDEWLHRTGRAPPEWLLNELVSYHCVFRISNGWLSSHTMIWVSCGLQLLRGQIRHLCGIASGPISPKLGQIRWWKACLLNWYKKEPNQKQHSIKG
jgi:hypothetical protein